MAPPSHAALLMIVLHSKLCVALWSSALPQLQPLYGPEIISKDLPPDSLHVLEPHFDIPQVHLVTTSELWPPHALFLAWQEEYESQTCQANPFSVKGHEHLCQVSPVFTPSTHEQPQHTADLSKQSINLSPSISGTNFSSAVRVDQDNLLQPDMQSSFQSLLSDFDSVFDPTIQGYNGAIGPFEAKVNMDPVEPTQRKHRVPQYARNKLVDLQNKFDTLEKLGVFKRPEE